MASIKILFTINSLIIKKEKLFRQNTIYNSFRLKKHLVLIRKIHLVKKYIRIKNISFQLNKSISIKKKNYFQGRLHS